MLLDSPDLGFVGGLALAFGFGGFGGFVYGVSSLIEMGKSAAREYTELNGIPVRNFLTTRFLVGGGGGFAALFVTLSVGKYKEAPTSQDLLLLATLCFIAGYIGHRILPAVAARVERELADVKQQAQAAEKKAVAAQKKFEGLIGRYGELNGEIQLGRELLRPGARQPAFTASIVRSLESFLVEFPLHRNLNFVLEDLYTTGLGNVDKGIAVLRDFIRRKQQASEGNDRDVADAWFNIACDISSRILPQLSGEAKEIAIREGVNAIRDSLIIMPEYAEDARLEPDLDNLVRTGKLDSLLPDSAG